MGTLTVDKAWPPVQGQIWQQSRTGAWALRWSYFFLTLPLS